MLQQRTLKTLTRAVGVGLHSGQRVELTLRPAPAGHRHRVPARRPADAGGHPGVGAGGDATRGWPRPSPTGGAKVHTVEHLMSACAGLGIDNLYVDITAEEVPILDGSSASFVFLLQSAGIGLQNAPQPLHPRAEAGRGARGRGRQPEVGAARALPRLQAALRDRFRPPGGRVPPASASSSTWARGSYKRDIARARTFGFTKDVEMMRANGLASAAAWTTPIVDGRLPGAQRRRPALRRRVREAQDPRRHRRPVPDRPPAAGRATAPSARATR